MAAFTSTFRRNCSYLAAPLNCSELDLFPNPACLPPTTNHSMAGQPLHPIPPCDQPCLTTCAKSMGGSAKLVGVITTLLFSTVLNFGQNLLRKGNLVAQTDPALRGSVFRSKWWWSGLVVFVAGNCGDFLSYLCAPPSIIAPLGSVSLVSNNFIAHFFLGENISWRDALATALIVSGAVLTTVYVRRRERGRAGGREGETEGVWIGGEKVGEAERLARPQSART